MKESLSDQIVALIFDRRYDEANTMIKSAREALSAEKSHRLTALAAVVQKEIGNLHLSIDLMYAARNEARTWLPHLYRLSVYLMDAQRWSDADIALDELISLSEAKNDSYFLDEARIRKIFCLKALNRNNEVKSQRAKISTSVRVFIGDKQYKPEDFD